MERMSLVSALNTAVGGATAFEECYGQALAAELSEVPGHTVVLSYAPPDMVRQAKLEAMAIKVRQKMMQRKASLLDTHALSEFNPTEAPSIAVRVIACADGSRELVKSLVVPPEFTEHGEEVCGSSEFILDGERLEYQRPGRVAAAGSQTIRPMPLYRTYDPGQKTSSPGNPKKKAWGVVESADMARDKGSRNGGNGGGGAGGLYGGAPTGHSGGGKGRDAAAVRQELEAQLSDGMLTYVPSLFERPKGVERTAFVPQGQAMEQARHKYQSVKQRRPISAPPRRGAAAAVAAPSGAGDADGTGTQGGGGAGGSGAGRPPADGSLTSNGLSSNITASRDKKWGDVTVVHVEETDLLATYRQNSKQQQEQQQQSGAGTSRSASMKLPAGSLQSSPPTTAKPAAVTKAGYGPSGGPHGRQNTGGGIRQPTGVGSIPASRKNLATTAASAAGTTAERSRQGDVVAKVRSKPASVARTAWPSKSPPRTDAKPNTNARGASKAAKRPIAPATAAEAAALAAAAAGGPSSSRPAAAWAWEGPRPPSPRRTPAPSRPSSQRRIDVSSAAGTGTSVAAVAAAIATASGGSADAAGSAARVSLQPVDPETRRQRQNRPGSAISTAKTNRLRVPARSGGASAYGIPTNAAPTADGGWPQPAWTTSSSTLPPSCDRSQLQERILGGLVRQITLGAEDEDTDNSTMPMGASSATADGTAQWRPGRTRATSDAAAITSSNGGGGGLLSSQRSMNTGQGDQRQQYQPPSSASHAISRPQSAPNRRLRPPSPGHWAGRPDPDALLARTTVQHSMTGILYDPEVQPSPLDSYVNQLNGLD
ncbi:hypothetical protein Vretimale_4418 [Volvox reticuliferus]|uniref:Uncharacterized protein n=1 Tax=Volvox reticuliferus TaxID=1737510 RepID=A0A8J4G2G0_9CHLO|nr:hypothetical protein Vretifemale_3015 [Volvox reticuliferus]GIL99191.1 hypothetical protein Vretimale_4418 [Volvox reticuliferus]